MKTNEYEYMLVVETNNRKFNCFVKLDKPLNNAEEIQKSIRELEKKFNSYVVILNWILLNIERND